MYSRLPISRQEHRPRPVKGSAGFTLVEVLMVVVILGIVGAIVIPQMGSRDDLKIASAARTIIADLSYAQAQAIATQKKCYVVFNGNRYEIQAADTGGVLGVIAHPVNPTNYSTDFGIGTLRGVSIADVDFDNQTTLAFDELGSPMAYNTTTNSAVPLSATGEVQLLCGAESMTIRIETYTGEISVSTP